MLLLTMREWLGPQHTKYPDSADRPTPKVQTVAFATRLALSEALLRIQKYEVAYKLRYPLAVEFSLLSVTTIDDLTDETLERARVSIVEHLPTTAEEIE